MLEKRTETIENMKIAIVGRTLDTVNYVKYAQSINAVPVVTLDMEDVKGCDALLLPGGGDITPAFFGSRIMALAISTPH